MAATIQIDARIASGRFPFASLRLEPQISPFSATSTELNDQRPDLSSAWQPRKLLRSRTSAQI